MEVKSKFILSLLCSILFMKTCFAEIAIYCPHCKVHLYNYQKDEIKIGDTLPATDFTPARADIPQPIDSDLFACPFDGCPLNQYESWAWERKENPPVFHVWAISLLTKDKDGNWIGVPYDVEIEDWEEKYR